MANLLKKGDGHLDAISHKVQLRVRRGQRQKSAAEQRGACFDPVKPS